MAENKLHLGHWRSGIQRNDGDTGSEAAKIGDVPFGAVGGPYRDAVPLFEPKRHQIAANGKHPFHESGREARHNLAVFAPESEQVFPRRSLGYLEEQINQGAHAPNTFRSEGQARATMAAIWPLQDRDKKIPVRLASSRASLDFS